MKRFLPFLAVAAVVVGVGLFLTVHENQVNLLTLEGKITDVRLIELSDGATLALVDFDMMNPSDSAFEVRAAGMAALDREAVAEGKMFSKREAKSYFDYEKFSPKHPLFGAGDVVKAHASVKGSMMARFEAGRAELRTKTLRVQFTSVNGIATQLVGTFGMDKIK